MSTLIKGSDVRTMDRGIRVKKTIASTTNATQGLFTVTGLVIVQGIVGSVKVAFDGTTTSINIIHTATIGGAADLCAATVVTSDAVGTVYGFIGSVITTLLVGDGTAAPNTQFAPLSAPKVLTPGVIGFKGTAVDAGSTDWYVLYAPLSDDGLIVAV